MKSSIFLPLFLSCGLLAWSQATTPPKPSPAPESQQPPAAGSTSGLKVRGPEAVAQQDPQRVVATIEGKQITAQQALEILKLVPDNQKRATTNLSVLLEQTYMVEQLADQAAKLKLDQQSPWKEDLQFDRERILAQAYVNRLTTTDGPEATAAKQYYDAHPDEFDEAKVSGIFVAFTAPGTPAGAGATARTESQARDKVSDLEKKIKAGTDFSTLARSDSDNKPSAAKGGDLGTLTPTTANIPEDIKTAIFKLQPGQVSEPVRLPNGFYIFKLNSRTKQTFEQARAGIILQQMYSKYKIQVQDPDFFSASPSTGTNIPSLARPSTPQPGQTAVKPQSQK